MLNLSEGSKRAITLLKGAGYEAYAVGGAIRDSIMGRVANDFDVTTSATPEQMKRVFERERVIETGLKHGTLTLLYKGECVEVTTYRIDGEYLDSRRPQSVEFTTSLDKDLSRRDFTINALAYDPISDTLVDLFDGQEDIKNKVIRSIGEPERRFSEDALRILRGVRFASQLGFKIEEKTKKAMLSTLHLLKNVSRERIASELNGLLCGAYAKNTILEHYDILCAILPELEIMHGFDQKNSWHIYDILTHTAVVVDNVRPIPHMRLMAFLHDIGKVTTFHLDGNGVGHFWGHNEASERRAREFFNEYKYDNFTKDRVCKIIGQHDAHIKADSVSVKRRLHDMGNDAFLELLELQRADNIAQNPEKTDMKHFDIVRQIYDKIIENNECFMMKQLDINGGDLMQNGFEKGEIIGDVLEFLLNEVIEERLPNEKQILIKKAKEQFLK